MLLEARWQKLYSRIIRQEVMSSGIRVFERENQKIKDVPSAEPVIRFIKKEGIDISENIRKQLTQEMVREYDKIVVMAEKEIIPEFLLNNEKVIFWDIEDPKGKSDKEYADLVTALKELIKKFIIEENIK